MLKLKNMINEQQLKNWARALSETENAKCITTVDAIKKLLNDYFGKRVDVFLQGSYKNKTNVRQDSDVDIVVCCLDNVFFSDISGLTPQDKELHKSIYSTSSYTFSQFKDEVCSVLTSKFLTDVERKNKCIKIKGNSYRVDADVVPCFVHKRFKTATDVLAEGIEFISDTGSTVNSFPKQHYDSGASKNIQTDEMYKKTVRTLKNCRNRLIDSASMIDKDMASFFLECLVWNVPENYFNYKNHKDVINSVLEKIYADMQDFEKADTYAEVSDLMWLFRGKTERTTEKAKIFCEKAYKLIN